MKVIKGLMHNLANANDYYVRDNFLNSVTTSTHQEFRGHRPREVEDVIGDLLFDVLLIYTEDEDLELRGKAFQCLRKFLDDIFENTAFIERKIPPVLQFVRRSRRYCNKKLYLSAYQLFKVLAQMAYLVGPQKTEELILDQYLEFCTWPLYSNLFRRVSVMIFPIICYVMGTPYTEEKLLDHFVNLCRDRSWIVRQMCANYIVQVSLMCSPEVRRTKMAQIVLDLAKDEHRAIVRMVLLNMGRFISTLATPCITGLVYTGYRNQLFDYPFAELQELHVIFPTIDCFRHYASPQLLANYQYYVDTFSIAEDLTKNPQFKKRNSPPKITTKIRPKWDVSPEEISEWIEATRQNIFKFAGLILDSMEIISPASFVEDNWLSLTWESTVPYSNEGAKPRRRSIIERRLSRDKGGKETNVSTPVESETPVENNDLDAEEVVKKIHTKNRWISVPANLPNFIKGCIQEKRPAPVPMSLECMYSQVNFKAEEIDLSYYEDSEMSPSEAMSDSRNDDSGSGGEGDDFMEFNSHRYWSTLVDVPLDVSLIKKNTEKSESKVPAHISLFEELYANDIMPPNYEQSVVPSEILKTFFASIAFGGKDNMRLVCAYNIPAVAITLGRSNWYILQPFFKFLSGDIDAKVQKTIASSIVLLANLLDKDTVRKDLVPVFVNFFKRHDDVKMEAIKNLFDFFMAIEWYQSDELFLRILTALYQGGEINWHIVDDFAKTVYFLVKEPGFITKLEGFLYVASFAALLLEDKISIIRTMGSHLFAQLLRVSHRNEMAGILHYLRTKFAQNESFKRRQSYVHVLINGYKYGAPPSELLSIVLPVVERLSTDPISNVRLVVARYLVESINKGEVTTNLNSSEVCSVLSMVKRLGCDEDGVVRDIISEITESKLNEMNSIEEGNSTQNSSMIPLPGVGKQEEGEGEESNKEGSSDNVDHQSVPKEEKISSTATEEITIKLRDAVVFESQL